MKPSTRLSVCQPTVSGRFSFNQPSRKEAGEAEEEEEEEAG